MSSITENILNNKSKTIEQIRQEIKSLTGIIMTDSAITYLMTKFPRQFCDITNYENELDYILEEYDKYQLSNITEEQKEHQRKMEEYATENKSTVEGATRYYKLNNTYFEWNELHRLEHPERENSIEEIADAILNRVINIKVDTRKPYGEVRYLLTCSSNSDRKQIVITCYRYDKYHIRIITVWKE